MLVVLFIIYLEPFLSITTTDKKLFLQSSYKLKGEENTADEEYSRQVVESKKMPFESNTLYICNFLCILSTALSTTFKKGVAAIDQKRSEIPRDVVSTIQSTETRSSPMRWDLATVWWIS
jgi:hypothetical protein